MENLGVLVSSIRPKKCEKMSIGILIPNRIENKNLGKPPANEQKLGFDSLPCPQKMCF